MALLSGSLLSGALLLASVLVGWQSYDRARPYSLLENALYAGTHRSVWALGMAWFILAEGTTGFGRCTLNTDKPNRKIKTFL